MSAMSAVDDADTPRGGMTAAGRLLAILEVFRSHYAPLTLAEISRRSGLSMTTAHRLTHELLDWSALERTEDGRFELGTKLLDFATASGNVMRLREAAIPALLRLHQMVRVLVVLMAVRDGFETVYVESLRARNGRIRMNRIGGRMPLHATPLGLVLLAYADSETQDDYLRRPLTAFTPATMTDPGLLRRELSRIRTRESITTREQLMINTGGVAAPVFDREGRAIAAVGVVVDLSEGVLEAHTPLVKAAATSISRGLDRPDDMPERVRRAGVA